MDLGRAVEEAAEAGRLEVVRFLLSDGRTISEYFLGKATVNAVEAGRLEVVRLLCKDKLFELKSLTSGDFDSILNVIVSIKNIEIRGHLFDAFISLLKTHQELFAMVLEHKSKICGDQKNANNNFLQLMIFFLCFTKEKANLDELLSKFSDYKRILKSTEYFLPFLNLLYLIDKSSCEKKDGIILHLLTSRETANKQRNLQSMVSYMTALLSLDSTDWIEGFLAANEGKKEYLFSLLLKSLQTKLGNSLTFSPEDFEETLKDMRNQGALFSYLKTVKDYPKQMGSVYSTFLQKVIEGNFQHWRNDELTSAHIDKIKRDHSLIWSKWIHPEVTDATSMPAGSSSDPIDSLSYIREKFSDRHYLTEDGSIHPNLEGFEELISKTKEEMQEKLTELEAAESAPATPRVITQTALLKMILATDIETIKSQIEIALEHLGGCELIRDLTSFKDSLALTILRSEPCVVTNTDKWEDLFLSGTEVIGSCQSIRSSSGTNRCLMGYVIDAKNRMIAVKSSKTGQIESRAIFRLLLSDEGPVLFLDRIYSKFPTAPKEHTGAIYKHAKSIADNLGLALYEYKAAGISSLKSLGSPAPFEYEDAVGGITSGAFTIACASRI